MRERFSEVDRLDLPEGLWDEAARRSNSMPPQPPPPSGPTRGGRALAIAVAFAVFAVAAIFAWGALGPSDRHSRPADPTPTPSPSGADLLADIPEGWSELPPPPEVRSGAATAWTGQDLLVWGGYVFEGSGDKPPSSDGSVFDARTRSWTPMPESPLSSRSTPASAWTGSELLIWGGWDGTWDAGPGVLDDGAALDPSTGAWRALPPAPITARAPFSVWTGREMIVWGTALRVSDPPRDGAAYDPATDAWRTIAVAPIALTDGTAIWTGREMIVFGAALHGGNEAETPTAIGAAYDPEADTWRRLPDSTLSPQASTAAWNGREMIAWDYLTGSAAYEPETDTWRELPGFPGGAAECGPKSIAIGPDILGQCPSPVLFDGDRDRWREVAPRGDDVFVELVAAGDIALVPSHDLVSGEIRMFAFRPPTGTVGTATMLTEGISNSMAWSLVADPGGGRPSLELRVAEGQDVRLPFGGPEELRTAIRAFGGGDIDDVVVFGLVPTGTDEVRLVPGQGLPERTAQPISIPGTDRPAFAMTAYAGIGILTATSDDGSVLARELLLPPGGDRVRAFVDGFLVARAEGTGAEAFLARGAGGRFGHSLGGLGPIYGPGSGYTGSSIVFIAGPIPPDKSYEIGVVLRGVDGPPAEETLFVGPGVDDSGVRRDLLVVGGRTGTTGP